MTDVLKKLKEKMALDDVATQFRLAELNGEHGAIANYDHLEGASLENSRLQAIVLKEVGAIMAEATCDRSYGDEMREKYEDSKETLGKLQAQVGELVEALEKIKNETGGYALEFKRFVDGGDEIPSYAFENVCGRMREIARQALAKFRGEKE